MSKNRDELINCKIARPGAMSSIDPFRACADDSGISAERLFVRLRSVLSWPAESIDQIGWSALITGAENDLIDRDTLIPGTLNGQVVGTDQLMKALENRNTSGQH